MKDKKIWDVLILTGNFKDIEILSSYIYDKSLGSYFLDDSCYYYFDNNKKDSVENILKKYINRFDITFSWNVQKEENWHLNWKDNFKPIKVNDDLIIIPDWDKDSYAYHKIVRIKPGMAFGTGHHETTFLMLKYLTNNIQQGDTILDLGSGSGILSIASHMYQAKKITAVEFDLVCKTNFFENLKINNIKKNNIELIIDDVLSVTNFDYDIILANINKNIIKKLISKFKNTKAKILLSGILVQDAHEIRLLLASQNIKLICEDKYNEWLLMVIQNA